MTFLVQIVDAQHRRHAEVGVHGPLCVGGHHDYASAGRNRLLATPARKRHAHGSHVVTEDLPEVVGVDFADVRRPAAEARYAAHGVGG